MKLVAIKNFPPAWVFNATLIRVGTSEQRHPSRDLEQKTQFSWEFCNMHEAQRSDMRNPFLIHPQPFSLCYVFLFQEDGTRRHEVVNKLYSIKEIEYRKHRLNDVVHSRTVYQLHFKAFLKLRGKYNAAYQQLSDNLDYLCLHNSLATINQRWATIKALAWLNNQI